MAEPKEKGGYGKGGASLFLALASVERCCLAGKSRERRGRITARYSPLLASPCMIRQCSSMGDVSLQHIYIHEHEMESIRTQQQSRVWLF